MAWLDSHPGWKRVDLDGPERWTEIILRSTFGRREPTAPVAPDPDPPE